MSAMDPPRTALDSLASGTSFRLGSWEVEPQRLRLYGNGDEVRLEPRVMALLVCLAEDAGRPVTRDDLRSRVWDDVVVGDDAIHSAVAKLRRALEAGGLTDAIQTLPKVGYRLRAPVAWQVQASSDRPVPEGEADTSAEPLEGEDSSGNEASFGWSRFTLPAVVLALVLSFTVLERTGPEPAVPSVVDSLGRDVRPITSWIGREVEPAFSPGGTGDRVAFVWKGPEQDNWDVWVTVLGAGDPLRLTSHPGIDYSPTWSPDGRHVAFLRADDGHCSVLRVPALGGTEQRLASCTGGESLDWSPDGSRLVWAERPQPDSSYRIFEVTLEDRTRREITSPPAGSVGDLCPELSPDGETLAFLRSPVLGVQDIYLQRVDGSDPPRRLTSDGLKIHGADWTPDGRSLVFSSNRGGLFSLWKVDVEGGVPRWLGASGGEPTVGSGGRLVAYEQWDDDTNIYVFPLDGESEPRLALGSTRWDWGPDVSPTGRIVFVSDRSGSSELWLRESSASTARQLTEMGGPYMSHPRWSPDGTVVAFDARPGGNADVYLLDDGELAPRRLTEHSAQDLVPTWSRDRERPKLYFASDRDGSWQLWSLSADGGEPERVTELGGYFGQESVDRRWLYFSRHHQAGIWRRPLGQPGEPELVVDDLLPIDRTHWVVGEEALFYLRRPRHGGAVLTRFDPASGQAVELRELAEITHNSGLALARGGAAVYFTRFDRRESDILVLQLGDRGS